MTDVKIFRIIGTYRDIRNGFTQAFKFELRALKEEEAKEKVYSELGSKHRIRRRFINIERVEVVEDSSEVENSMIQYFTSENAKIIK
ncbi:MAG: 50S ribosomal protein L18Ae [Candidatus Hodarchaeota archaeon]